MARCVFIIQGEGKGHMSQSMAMAEYLEDAGHQVEAAYVGCSDRVQVPGYFKAFFGDRMHCMSSPYLLRSPNRKGILVGKTILFNFTRSVTYLSEIRRIRRAVNSMRPDVVFNFYDLVGALALRRLDPKIRRIGIGHQFFLHMEKYPCDEGPALHRWLLRIFTGLVMRSCDRVLALSFRETRGKGKIEVVPPLIRKKFREISYRPGDRYLAYLLTEGYVYELVTLARADPDFRADVFTDLTPEMEVPPGLQLHSPDEANFTEKMASCRGLITTSGFDAVAEAAYLGLPMVVIPVRNHFEQLCNSLDTERSGFGLRTMKLVPGIETKMRPYDNRTYRRWVDTVGKRIFKMME
ncbi:MAG: glycosyltransferase family protein [Bacteroidota bacterium]